MTVAHLLATMSSAELSEWMALAEIEHEERGDRERAAKAKSGAQTRQKRALGKR